MTKSKDSSDETSCPVSRGPLQAHPEYGREPLRREQLTSSQRGRGHGCGGRHILKQTHLVIKTEERLALTELEQRDVPSKTTTTKTCSLAATTVATGKQQNLQVNPLRHGPTLQQCPSRRRRQAATFWNSKLIGWMVDLTDELDEDPEECGSIVKSTNVFGTKGACAVRPSEHVLQQE
ncbi:hypothetical protein PI124_g17056 [Phytophthora idaei]|nr:hypothetical protein PI124_g17056 [Phytophthora idaei]